MKKLLLGIFICLLATPAFAQYTAKRTATISSLAQFPDLCAANELIVRNGTDTANVCAVNASGGASTAASYITSVAEAGLSNETALGALGTGLLINTTTTGIPTIYAGQTCTNQFVRAISASGGATCATVATTDLAAGVTLDTEWDSAAEINTATTDDDFVTLTGVQSLATGTKTVTSKFDFGGGIFEIPNSITLPATCIVGELYMDTDATTGQRIYACQAVNTWALQGDGGAGGGLVSADIDTSAELDAIVTDDTGSGALVFANTPTMVTPVLGAATGTSLVLSSTITASNLTPSGTLTNTRICTYDSAAPDIDCDLNSSGTGDVARITTPTIATPILTGKIDRNNVAVDDDDCTGEQGLYWYDTTDSAFEFCNASSGAPTVLGGGGSQTHSILARAGAAASSHTGTTAETTIASTTLPALSANDTIRISMDWSQTANANAKTVRVRMDGLTGTIFTSVNCVSALSCYIEMSIMNRNATNSNVGWIRSVNVNGGGLAPGIHNTGAIQTNTGAVVLAITAQLADGADSMTLEAYMIERISNGS